jgi:hypothetical protein
VIVENQTKSIGWTSLRETNTLLLMRDIDLGVAAIKEGDHLMKKGKNSPSTFFSQSKEGLLRGDSLVIVNDAAGAHCCCCYR